MTVATEVAGQDLLEALREKAEDASFSPSLLEFWLENTAMVLETIRTMDSWMVEIRHCGNLV